MPTVSIHQVDAFTRTPFTGNPAGVVANAAGLSDEQMQAVAAEMNCSETTFILPPDGDDHDVRLRYFTPTCEVPSCGHATIAAYYVRATLDAALPRRFVQKVGAGLMPIGVDEAEGDLRITMTQRPPTFEPPVDDAVRASILEAFGLKPKQVRDDVPIQIVDTGHSKVMVPIRDGSILHALTPNGPALAAISRQIGSNGYYVFTFDAGDDDAPVHGRMFAPAIGIAEDPVTGNANGPCGAYLVKHGLIEATGDVVRVRGRQGEAMGRPGTVHVTVTVEAGEPVGVSIAGDAVIVFEGRIRM